MPKGVGAAMYSTLVLASFDAILRFSVCLSCNSLMLVRAIRVQPFLSLVFCLCFLCTLYTTVRCCCTAYQNFICFCTVFCYCLSTYGYYAELVFSIRTIVLVWAAVASSYLMVLCISIVCDIKIQYLFIPLAYSLSLTYYLILSLSFRLISPAQLFF